MFTWNFMSSSSLWPIKKHFHRSWWSHGWGDDIPLVVNLLKLRWRESRAPSNPTERRKLCSRLLSSFISSTKLQSSCHLNVHVTCQKLILLIPSIWVRRQGKLRTNLTYPNLMLTCTYTYMWIYMYLIFFTEIYFMFPCNQLKKIQQQIICNLQTWEILFVMLAETE